MNRRLTALSLLLLMIIATPPAHAAEEVTPPDEAATRKKVDDLISRFKDQKKATTGMIEQAIGLSISFAHPLIIPAIMGPVLAFMSRPLNRWLPLLSLLTPPRLPGAHHLMT